MRIAPEKTLDLLTKALEIAPGDWETRRHMAEFCLALGQRDRAADLLRRCPALPDDKAGRLAAGELFIRCGEPGRARRIAGGLLGRNRADAKAYLLLAQAHRAEGDRAAAGRAYHTAAAIDESHDDPEFEDWLYTAG